MTPASLIEPMTDAPPPASAAAAPLYRRLTVSAEVPDGLVPAPVTPRRRDSATGRTWLPEESVAGQRRTSAMLSKPCRFRRRSGTKAATSLVYVA